MIDDCARIEDLIFYALKLEKAAIAVQRLIEGGELRFAGRITGRSARPGGSLPGSGAYLCRE
jgi:hypothetical protein